MIFTKKYNLINNSIGWGVFLIALATYWLTLEPTASYWDCGEFIIQADKLEIGHPPGNPIFMLTANFFTNFTTDITKVALMVNAMSGLLSALTILLLFWTITHLARKLVTSGNASKNSELSLSQYIVVMGSGIVGALAYTWSDTFWFSATEAEVYAFSSFCTALVFWLILKWENRADDPHSDRYLILIAYVIGVSVAVHLLNLLCIPAIVLVFAYRKFTGMNVKKSIYALLVSFAIIVLVLYGLVPGFIKVAQWFELLCVNSLGMAFNSGVLVYTILTVGIFCWTLLELYRQDSNVRMGISFCLSVFLSGMLFLGSNLWIGIVLILALVATMGWFMLKKFPVRILNVAMWSIFVIFIGYSSYALILIRSSADTPMNQNSPDNVFALSSYLSREQYGQTPLLYGQTLNSKQMQLIESTDVYPIQNEMTGATYELPTHRYSTYIEKGKGLYAKGVEGARPHSSQGFLSEDEINQNDRLAESGHDYYTLYDYENEIVMNPELNMVFPRIHSSAHKSYYPYWVSGINDPGSMVKEELFAVDAEGEKFPEQDQSDYKINPNSGIAYWPQSVGYRPTMGQNIEFFLNYQLNHMYWRYFLWNFAGRQNDINNQFGEKDAGNWISGIPLIDDARLGDQSLLPYDQGEGNKGHNVYYMLPLILGIIGLLWQSLSGKHGVEQFWVIFFLFFMTGIAIVLYLNQPPNQPRERDYAFAGSFYAFAIWIGLGVAGLWRMLILGNKKRWSIGKARFPKYTAEAATEVEKEKTSCIFALIAAVLGLCVPLQMVSQTWDDHDRSGRYVARDFAINYLQSLEPNAIIFCNGDNDTFPLWYAQEVEGVRPDVRIINLSYINSDWYANQQRLPAYQAAPVKFTAKPQDYAYGLRDVVYHLGSMTDSSTPVPLVEALKAIYDKSATDNDYNLPGLKYSNTYIPVYADAVLKAGLVTREDIDNGLVLSEIPVKLNTMSLGQILMLDIIATNAENGWERPIYWASTVGNDCHLGLTPYMKSVGMAYQLVPMQKNLESDTDKGYDVVMKKYHWGGLDKATEDWAPYLDETARRMLSGVRMSMFDLAEQLITEGYNYKNYAEYEPEKASEYNKKAQECFDKAGKVLVKMEEKLPEYAKPYDLTEGIVIGRAYGDLGITLNDEKFTRRGLEIFENLISRYARNVEYSASMYNEAFKKHKKKENEIYSACVKELENKVNAAFSVYAQYYDAETIKNLTTQYLAQIGYKDDAKILATQKVDDYAKGENLFTRDTQSILENYHALIELYNEYGGNFDALNKKLNLFDGLTIEGNESYDDYGNKKKLTPFEILKLKYETSTIREDVDNYVKDYYDNAPAHIDEVLQDSASASVDDDALLDDYLAELVKYAEIVTVMQSKSAGEYALSQPEEFQVDSLYHFLVEEYLNMGGKKENMTDPLFNQVDKARSKRLAEEFKANNPHYFE